MNIQWMVFVVSLLLFSNISAEEPLDFKINPDEWSYVVIMLSSASGGTNTEKPKRTINGLQEKVLNGPLKSDFHVVHRYETVPALAGWMKKTASVSRIKEDALDSDIVLRIDEDSSGQGYEAPSNSGGGGTISENVSLINADLIHRIGLTGKGIEVAVLDSGIDTDHPDLADSVLAEQCFCMNLSTGCCPSSGSRQSGPGSAEDDNRHGTLVSGVITSNGTVAVTGVAPDAGITAIKMLDSSRRFLSTSDIVASLDWINVNRSDVDVVNMSLQTDATFSTACDSTSSWAQAMFRAVQNLVDKGVIVISIAGNDGLIGSSTAPGCLSNVISVGATDINDVVAQFSNSHSEVDLLAPGVDILTTILGGGAREASGTSFACPHVSGLAALMKQASPSISGDDFLSIASNTGVLITDRGGLPRPRIDAFNAVCAVYDCDSEFRLSPILDFLLNTRSN